MSITLNQGECKKSKKPENISNDDMEKKNMIPKSHEKKKKKTKQLLHGR
jgi:hypothetical protein